MDDTDVHIDLGTVERREAFAKSSTVVARWSDGLGSREEKLTLLDS
jgi:hypothetical protein